MILEINDKGYRFYSFKNARGRKRAKGAAIYVVPGFRRGGLFSGLSRGRYALSAMRRAGKEGMGGLGHGGGGGGGTRGGGRGRVGDVLGRVLIKLPALRPFRLPFTFYLL